MDLQGFFLPEECQCSHVSILWDSAQFNGREGIVFVSCSSGPWTEQFLSKPWHRAAKQLLGPIVVQKCAFWQLLIMYLLWTVSNLIHLLFSECIYPTSNGSSKWVSYVPERKHKQQLISLLLFSSNLFIYFPELFIRCIRSYRMEGSFLWHLWLSSFWQNSSSTIIDLNCVWDEIPNFALNWEQLKRTTNWMEQVKQTGSSWWYLLCVNNKTNQKGNRLMKLSCDVCKDRKQGVI